jgi:hypothetical protein
MMALRMISTQPQQTAPVRTAEKMTSRGMVLWTITADPAARPVNRIHWRLADGKKPPLDVAINRQTGLFQELTFFIQDEVVLRTTDHPAPTERQAGQPQFETDSWQPGQYDRDEPGQATFALDGRNLYVLFQGMAPATSIADAGTVQFLLDGQQQVAGIVLPALDDSLLAVMREAQVLEA